MTTIAQRVLAHYPVQPLNDADGIECFAYMVNLDPKGLGELGSDGNIKFSFTDGSKLMLDKPSGKLVSVQ